MKQSSKNWSEKFSAYLKTLGFESTDDDPCVYYNKEKSIIVILFVDDGIIAENNKSRMIEILKKVN